MSGLRAVVCWWGVAWATPGWAADVALAEGPLRPGRAATLRVATSGDVMPRLKVEGGIAIPGALAGGVAEFVVVPQGPQLVVDVDGARRVFDVRPPGPGRLEVAGRVDATVGAESVRIEVRGAGLRPEHLEVAVGEGPPAAVEATPDGLSVVIRPEDSPFPRLVAVGIRDRRTDDAPQWVAVRLRARPRLPLEAEPGASLTLTVGGRTYGPFPADERGHIEAVFDQYPGEASAVAWLRDELGNETRAEMPLSASPGLALVGMVSGRLLPDQRPPSIFLHAIRGDGASGSASPPACRTPDADLRVTEVGPQGWFAPLPREEELGDVRVVCQADDATWSARVQVGEGVPADLKLAVFPDELRSDFPEAEVRVVVEDARGDRLEPDGVVLRAARGELRGQVVAGQVLRADYVGTAAVDAGSDRIEAELRLPAGRGPAQRLRVDGEVVAQGLRVVARVDDADGLPLAGASVVVGSGDSRQELVTGGDGAAVAVIPAPPGRVWATAGPWTAEGLAIAGRPVASPPGAPDRTASRQVEVRSGSVSGLSVAVDPPLLRASPGAIAWITVRAEDRAGLPVSDRAIRLEVSEGVVSELRPRGNGEFIAEYVPPEGGGLRDVVVTAESDGLRTSTHLTVEPRVVRLSVGPSVGWQSNFGEVDGVAIGVDLDLRLRSRLVGESAMLRLGAAGWQVSTELDDGLSLRGTVVPMTAALLLRQDAGAWGLWGGAGGAAAVQRLQLLAGEAVVSDGGRWLFGPTVLVGVGRRAFGGELVGEVRALWINGPTGEVGYRGNLGGLGGVLGWRVVY